MQMWKSKRAREREVEKTEIAAIYQKPEGGRVKASVECHAVGAKREGIGGATGRLRWSPAGPRRPAGQTLARCPGSTWLLPGSFRGLMHGCGDEHLSPAFAASPLSPVDIDTHLDSPARHAWPARSGMRAKRLIVRSQYESGEGSRRGSRARVASGRARSMGRYGLFSPPAGA
eukprot:scaffold2645_cov112-Isochrysis_galbana.AAC.11